MGRFGRGFLCSLVLIAMPVMAGGCTNSAPGAGLDKEAEKHRLDQRESVELLAAAQIIARRGEEDCVRTGLTSGYVIACGSQGASRRDAVD